jgi:ATP/maltotriose-dependent transcriptional regulator MalT
MRIWRGCRVTRQVAKLRLDRALFELRARDLAFSPNEAAARFVLSGLTVRASDPHGLDALNGSSPAGLQLRLWPCAASAIHGG